MRSRTVNDVGITRDAWKTIRGKDVLLEQVQRRTVLRDCLATFPGDSVLEVRQDHATTADQ